MTEQPDIFALAKERASWEAVSGVTLKRAGKAQRGQCPLCKAGEKKGAAGPFWVRGASWGCFACKGEKAAGDIIDLEAELGRCTPREAAERLAGVSPTAWEPRKSPGPSAPAEVGVREPSGAPKAWIERVVREAQSIRFTPAQDYLIERGIVGQISDCAPTHTGLRFHPAVPWGWDERAGKVVKFPAMVALVETPGGYTGGIHATYLAKVDGRWTKAPVQPAKRMHGPQKDSLGRPGGCWVVGRPELPGLHNSVVVAEGIESAMSAAMLVGGNRRVLAALSLGRLQGGWLLDQYGRLAADTPAADPAVPALTWTGVESVIIAVDRDMKPVTVKARAATGGSYERRLDGEDRARICAGLAEQAWRRAGANRVRTIAPPAGLDFNDELRARAGR
jgi:hypothetical protein